MVFYAGAKNILTLLGEFKAYLINTGDWVDADPGFTDVVLRHVPTNNYLSIARANMKTGLRSGYQCVGSGLKITLSTGWDTNSHQPSGSMMHIFASLFESWYIDTSAWNRAKNYLDNYINNANNTYHVAYWVDKYGILCAIGNPSSYAGTDYGTLGVFFAVEYLPVAYREYNDGLSDFIMVQKQNDYGYWNGSDNDQNYAFLSARPYSLMTATRLYDQHEKGAFKSPGNGKVYFEFPMYFNDKEKVIPIGQTRRWFFVEQNRGIATSDVINWIDEQNQVVRRFYVHQVESVDRAEKFMVAIPYENAFEYPRSQS